MIYLLLALTIVLAAAGDIFYKIFDRKGEATFSDMQAFNLIRFAVPIIIVLIATFGALSFPSGLSILVGILFGVFSVIASMLSLYSIKTGPLSLFVMIRTGSAIVPAAYGILFLNNRLSASQTVGMTVLLVALILCAFERKEKEEKETMENGTAIKPGTEKKEVSLKWLLSSVGCMLLVGVNLVLLAVHQDKLQGLEINEMLLVTYICMTVFFGVICAASIFAAKVPLKTFRATGVILSAGSAGAGYASSLLLLTLISLVAPAVLFPTYYGGIVLFATLVAIVAFRERLPVIKWIGLAFGCVSLVLLQL